MPSRPLPALSDAHNEIRLLELPKTMDADFSISVCSLDDVPEYCALSYCWGAEEASTGIPIDGAEFPVRPNLKEALTQLLNKAQPRLIWIDAICIDQGNVSERNHQVRMMMRIYQQAQRVYVWLGPEDEFSKLPMSPYAASYFEHHITPNDFRADALLYQIYLFVQRPWWTRIWVLQEVASATSVEVLCGDDILEWGQLVFNLSQAAMLGEKVSKYLELKKTIKESYLVEVISTLGYVATFAMFAEDFPESRSQLLLLLQMHRNKICSDRRDKFYALLGLATEEDQAGHMIDYRLNLAQVYSKLAYRIIEQSGRLHILAYRWPVGAPNELPSWVPDWSDSTFDISYAVGFRQNGILHRSYFTAGGSRQLAADFNLDTLKLGLRGSIYGRTTFVLTLDPIDRVTLGGLLFIWGWVFCLAVGLKLPELGIELAKQFVRVMACDVLDSSESVRMRDCTVHEIAMWIESTKFMRDVRADPDTCGRARAVLKSLVEGLDQRILDGETREAIWDELILDADDSYAGHQLDPWKERCDCTRKGRSVILVDDSKFSLGPKTTENGDIIFIPLGSDVPLVIRSRETGDYTLVGECYVDGIMDGEAMRDIDDNELQTILLC